MKRATYLLPGLVLAITILATSCTQEAPPPTAQSQPGAPGPAPTTVIPADSVPLTKEQLKTIATNVKRWKAAGHSYSELNKKRAIDDGLVPKEMIRENGLVHLFGGPADIGAAPANAGVPDTFYVLFSGVPNDLCVKLAFPATDNFLVYAGNFLKTATSEEQAKSLCTTGNLWFIAK